ncbi:MAG TPA: hypothetical protein PLZ57_03965 [Pseudobdellovibrionaceae bacterium]|nr:hypothetical protein [Pseudobdellovibrionaceae bacterium]
MIKTRSRFSLRQAYDEATPQENGERVSASQRARPNFLTGVHRPKASRRRNVRSDAIETKRSGQ